MTISEFVFKNIKPAADKYIIVDNDKAGNNIPFHELYGYQHIIFDNITLDSEAKCNILHEIINKTGTGVTIYFDDSDDEFIGKFRERFDNKQINSKNNDSTTGIVIRHITDVGYMISSVFSLPWFETYTYSIHEYKEMLDKCVVVAIAKQEKHYIRDWVAYHLRIGFDKIYLYDNNDVNGESYDDILSEFIKSGRLEIINIRGVKGAQNTVYNMFYYSHPFGWVAVFDIDEYVWFNETGDFCDIKSFLANRCKATDRFGIMLQWHCYASSGDVMPSDKPIWESNNMMLPFNTRKDCRCEYIHNWCKSIYKPGYRITLNEHFGWENSHDGQIYGCSENDCNDRPIVKDSLIYISEKDFLEQPVYIKHFLLRNIDDFYHNKYLRGHAGGDFGIGVDGWAYYQWRHNMNYFTDIVGTLNNNEQIYLIKHGMKMNYTFHPDIFINWFILKNNKHINATITKILSDSFLPQANCFVNQFEIVVPDYDIPTDKSLLTEKDMGDVDFLVKYMYNYNYFDVSMDDYNVVRKNIQDPIVVNIGIPLRFATEYISVEEQRYYAEFLMKVFNKNSVRDFLRSALDDEVTTIPTIGITDNNVLCADFMGKLKPILDNMGYNMSANALQNNTLIMPFSQYEKIKSFQKEFVKNFGHADNNYICESIKKGIYTPYHTYIGSVMSVIENPFYVWPN